MHHDQQATQITVASFVNDLFDVAFNHLRVLVDQRKQSEINLIFSLMQELIHILETDMEQGLLPEYETKLCGLVTEFGYLVKYFR